MVARLAFTFAPHRAHIVQGILAAHGVSSWVWFEQAAHFYAPGLFGLAVMVNEDDMEDAREIINAPCEDWSSQSDANEINPAYQVLPGFLTCALAAFFATLGSLALRYLFHALFKIVSGRAMSSWNHDDVETMSEIVQTLVFSPVLALTWASLLWIFFLPLRMYKESPWMGLLAYLWVRVGFMIAIIVFVLTLALVISLSSVH